MLGLLFFVVSCIIAWILGNYAGWYFWGKPLGVPIQDAHLGPKKAFYKLRRTRGWTE